MRLLIAALALTALVAGCSGDDDGDDRAATNPTKAEQAARAEKKLDRILEKQLTAVEYRYLMNKMCQIGNEAAEKKPKPKNLDELIERLEASIKGSPSYIRRLEKIKPPPELRALHQANIDLNKESTRYFAEVVRAAKDSPVPAGVLAQALPKLDEFVARSNRLARRAKTPDCVEKQEGPGLDQPVPGIAA